MLIRLIVERFINNAAILKSDDSYSFVWPQAKLPANARIGSVLVFNILGDSVSDDDSKRVAREILNEILNVN
ncbi:MAG: hypothetical protein NT091_03860 [Candidatus Falkowbacteria bacterium]|nr:hypothetical protein [Candidatus Falkowbacteria bacterium]